MTTIRIPGHRPGRRPGGDTRRAAVSGCALVIVSLLCALGLTVPAAAEHRAERSPVTRTLVRPLTAPTAAAPIDMVDAERPGSTCHVGPGTATDPLPPPPLALHVPALRAFCLRPLPPPLLLPSFLLHSFRTPLHLHSPLRRQRQNVYKRQPPPPPPPPPPRRRPPPGRGPCRASPAPRTTAPTPSICTASRSSEPSRETPSPRSSCSSRFPLSPLLFWLSFA